MALHIDAVKALGCFWNMNYRIMKSDLANDFQMMINPGYHMVVDVINYTNRPIYVRGNQFKPTFEEVLPTEVSPGARVHSTVILRIRECTIKGSLPISTPPASMWISNDIVIDDNELRQHPIYIQELGWTVCHREQCELVLNIGEASLMAPYNIERLKQRCDNHWRQPMDCLFSMPKRAGEPMYMAVGKKIFEYRSIATDCTFPEFLINFRGDVGNSGDDLISLGHKMIDKLMSSDEVLEYKQTGLFFSTSLEQMLRFVEQRDFGKIYTEANLAERIKERLEEERAKFKIEKDALDLKLRAADNKYTELEARMNEEMHLKKIELERIKYETEEKIARMKVEKENASASSAKSTFFTTMCKTIGAAIGAIPIIIALWKTASA